MQHIPNRAQDLAERLVVLDNLVNRRATPRPIREDGLLIEGIKTAYQELAVVNAAVEQQLPVTNIMPLLASASKAVADVGKMFDEYRWLWSVEHTLRLERQLQALYNRPNCPIWRQYDSELNAALTSYEALLARALEYTKPPGQPSGFVGLIRRIYAARNRARVAYDAILKAGGISMRHVLMSRNKADLAELVDGMSVVEAVRATDDLLRCMADPKDFGTLRRIFPYQEAPVQQPQQAQHTVTTAAASPKKRQGFVKGKRQRPNRPRRRRH